VPLGYAASVTNSFLAGVNRFARFGEGLQVRMMQVMQGELTPSLRHLGRV